MSFYMIVRENEGDPAYVDLNGQQASAYKYGKNYDNMLSRLKSAALSEPGHKFFLLKADAVAEAPVDVVVTEYK